MSHTIPLSRARRAIVGTLRYAHQIPTIPVARPMNVLHLAHARRESPSPPSWSAIFIRAYGLACLHFPHLRRAWISWPFAHLYEHPHSVCAVAVERQWEGANVVLLGQIHEPEKTSLARISRHLLWYQQADVWSIASFRASLRFGAFPPLLQRMLLWHKLDTSGQRRIKYIGTFGMSNYGMLGAESGHPLGPQTTVLTLSPIKANGDVTVRLVYDHRVLDGGYVARALTCIEEVLSEAILPEIHAIRSQAA